jgi:hypothetical protein
MLGVFEVAQDGGDPPVHPVGGCQVKLGEDAANVLVDGAFGDKEPVGDPGRRRAR